MLAFDGETTGTVPMIAFDGEYEYGTGVKLLSVPVQVPVEYRGLGRTDNM